MDKKLVLAVAGSGKTYMLCNSVDPDKRNLILAFTNQNIRNIQNELLNRFDLVPEKTIISTFDKFVFNSCISPNHSMICNEYKVPPYRCEGVTIIAPPKPMINGRFNPAYIKDSSLRHYIPHKRYYCSLLSKLIMKNRVSLLPTVLERLNKFYDTLYIDEFQDYRNEDYDLLSEIIQRFNGDILLVGDYYQHSVSGDNNSGRPFGTTKKPVSYLEYKKVIQKQGMTIDESLLCKSRRCSKPLCDFIKAKMGIEIESFDNHEGSVKLISSADEARDILDDNNVRKLLLCESGKYCFVSSNWSYSKGDTYNAACVILTEETSNLIEDNFRCETIAPTTRNKLYVALTRSRTIVFLMTKNIFDEVKSKYLREI